jgi:CPA1 family monovalent cation:H+ antiporter
MALFDVLAVLMVLAATFGWLNARYARLPIPVAVMAMGLALSLALVGLSLVYPPVKVDAERLLATIDLDQLLLHGALGFLLFAGSLHVDFGDLRAHRTSIAVLAVVGTLISTGVVAGLCWLVARALGLGLAPVDCLLFGALISPTDPISVLGMLKSLHASRDLEVQIAGESLFNDCVGVVLFVTLLQVADGRQGLAGGGLVLELTVLVAREVLGGAAVGLVLGALAYLMLKRIDNYQVEILISLALVMAAYASAERLHLSAAIAAVTAGLLIGNQGRAFAMSERTRRHLDTFWELIDDILQALLFVLLGLEVLVLPARIEYLAAGVLAVPIALLARLISTWLSLLIGRVVVAPAPYMVGLLTWGGLRGGLAVALALVLRDHLPAGRADLLLVMTYVVVAFSVLVQGLSMKALVRRYLPAVREG